MKPSCKSKIRELLIALAFTGSTSKDLSNNDQCILLWVTSKVNLQGFESLWDGCTFIPADWGS